MEKHEEDLIQSLVGRNEELRRYYDEHIALEQQLSQFLKPRLSPTEEVEKKRLQKVKLAGKDKIMEILSRHR